MDRTAAVDAYFRDLIRVDGRDRVQLSGYIRFNLIASGIEDDGFILVNRVLGEFDRDSLSAKDLYVFEHAETKVIYYVSFSRYVLHGGKDSDDVLRVYFMPVRAAESKRSLTLV